MKKFLALLLGVSASLSSCYTYKDITTRADYDLYKAKKRVHVLNLVSHQDSLYFSLKYPAHMNDEDVSGVRQVQLRKFHADSLAFRPIKYKRIVEYAYKNGTKYNVMDDKGLYFIYDTATTVRIPYPEIDQLSLKIYNPGKSALLIGGSTGAFVGFLLLMFSGESFFGSDFTVW